MKTAQAYDPHLETKLRTLIDSAKDDHALALVYHHLRRHFKAQVTDAFLLNVLDRIGDWRAFLSSINEDILRANDDGSWLLAYLKTEVLPLIETHPLHKRLCRNLQQGLAIASTQPNLLRIAFNVCCVDIETTRQTLKASNQKITANFAEYTPQRMSSGALAGLILFVRQDVTDDRLLDPIEEHALLHDYPELRAAVHETRLQLETARRSLCQPA